ncbi:MAG: SPOR domain-containing protein, partial [Acidobacteria bacterium]|nr:SPOR domain-containing protein [Acidobacteriota bacterium]
MPPTLRTRVVSLFVAHALALAPLVGAQDSRPRRVPQRDEPQRAEPATRAETRRDEVPDIAPAAAQLARLETEPTVRVGLATSARAVTISTAGQLLIASDETGRMRATPEPVAVSRVRVEPRLLTPPQGSDGGLFRVEIAAVGSEDRAREIAREASELTGEAPEVSRDARSNSWRVRVGPPASRAESEELRARIEEAGIATFSIVNAQGEAASGGDAKAPWQTETARAAARPNSPNPKTAAAAPPPARGARQTGGLRLASRASLPTRGLVVYAGGAAQLLNARAPVTFAAADEQAAPLRFNEKPYR